MTPLHAPLVGVVLLNWNGYRETRRCLASLARVEYRPFTVYVADNGSTDGSADRLERDCAGSGTVLLRNDCEEAR